MKYRPILRGLISYVPILRKVIPTKGTGGSSSEYCYSVWLRHIYHLEASGMKLIPSIVAEIGPGDSLGVGLSALLSGSNKYIALDIIKHTEIESNLSILKKLIYKFEKHSDIPNGEEFKNVNPVIKDTKIPKIISEQSINNYSLVGSQIKDALIGNKTKDIEISYFVPWYDEFVREDNSCDLIISQAVMEHLPNINEAYKTMYSLVKKGGFISHQIDFKSHETADTWYGHFTYSKRVWSIIMHGRKYLINREPLSSHIIAIEQAGFEIIKILPVLSKIIPFKKIDTDLKAKFNDNDLITSSALIIARKD